MSYHTKKSADNRKVLALALQETLFVIAWGALAGALFLPLTNLWVYAILPTALISINFLVSMELSGDGSPLVSLGIRQHCSNGKKVVTRRAIFFRILLSVVLFPTALIGYIPLIFGKSSLPELITGIRLTAVDRRFDPRHPAVIDGIIKKTTIRFRALTAVPLVAAAAAFILFHSAPAVMSLQTANVQDGLPEHEQELLTHYLELTALHPEELEYHVRLASLYHRNNMRQDLMNELEFITNIDSTHAILILADTTSFAFEMLEPFPEDSSSDLNSATFAETTTDTRPDSTAADSTAADSTVSDSLAIQADSTELITTADSPISTTTDTVLFIPDTIPEELPDVLTDSLPVTPPDTSPPLPEEELNSTVEESAPSVVEEAEEETVEPDTLIQP